MGFEFSDSKATLEISGKTYTVDPYGDGALRAMAEYRQTLGIIAGREGADTAASVADVCAACARLIDALLGAGTYQILFAGREGDFLAHQELIGYIVGSLLAFRSAKVADAAAVGMEAARAVMGPQADNAAVSSEAAGRDGQG